MTAGSWAEDVSRERKGILVTGGMGNIGKYLVADLLSSGYQVLSLDVQDLSTQLNDIIRSRERRSNISGEHSNFNFIQGDIRNLTLLRSIFSPQNSFRVTGVIHLAAISRVVYCTDNEIDCRDVNVRGTAMILQAISEYELGRPWLIFSSSREVYGSSCTTHQPCSETSRIDPINLYGRTKWEGEQLIHRQSSQDLNAYTILRLSSVYGGLYDIHERLVPSIVRETIRNGTIKLTGGQQYFDFVHVEDVVLSVLRAVERLDSAALVAPKEVLICSGTSTSTIDIIQYVTATSQTRPNVIIEKMDSKFPTNFVCDNGRMIKNLLGHAIMYADFYKGVTSYTLSIYKRNANILDYQLKSQCNNVDFKFNTLKVAPIDRFGYRSQTISRCQSRYFAFQYIKSKLEKWTNSDHLPASVAVHLCDSDCLLVGSCIFTGECRCDIENACSDVHHATPFPFKSYAFTNITSYPDSVETSLI